MEALDLSVWGEEPSKELCWLSEASCHLIWFLWQEISLYYSTNIGLTVRVSLKSIAVVQEEVGSSDLRRGPAAWNSWILIDVLILPQPRLILQLLTV